MGAQSADGSGANDPCRTPPTGLTRQRREEVSPCWDMSQERVFIESVCNQRFNFFLVFFGASIVGAMNARTPTTQQLILGVGICIGTLLAIKLTGTFRRLEAVIRYIRTDPTHPETIISAELAHASRCWHFTRAVHVVIDAPGMFAVYQFWIPVICVLLQIAYLVALANGWHPNGGSQTPP